MITKCSVCKGEQRSCRRYVVRESKIYDVFICDFCERMIIKNLRICAICKKNIHEDEIKMSKSGVKFFRICKVCSNVLKGEKNENTVEQNQI